MSVQFKILGSCAGTGVPSFFCGCVGCQEARENPGLQRTRSGAFIDTGETRILIDASPDLRNQLIRENINGADCVFLTHWHADHYGGLGELEFYVRLKTKKPLDLYLPPSAIKQFESTYPDLIDIFKIIPWEFQKKYEFDQICLTPLPANHSVQTAGILVESDEKRLAYFPDTAGLPELTAREVKGVDYLICDATFYGDNWYPNSHMSVPQAIELGRKVRAKKTALTHLAIHYSQPVTNVQLEQEVSQHPGVMIVRDGTTFEILS